MNYVIGILLILTFLGMIYYCVKGYNLMVGFGIMATLWVILPLIGNAFSPNAAMKGKTIVDILTNVYQTGPQNYGSSILVNIYFGAFFGQVLVSTGIAATLIRKTVELGGDKPGITMALLCIITTVIFTSMTGAGPVIAIAVIVLPIMLSLGIPSPIALFAFMGSIMAGILMNPVNFAQYQAMFITLDKSYSSYTFNDYSHFGIIALIIALIMVIIVSSINLKKSKAVRTWSAQMEPQTATPNPTVTTPANAPWYSLIATILPVVGVLAFKIPVIFGFIFASIYALVTTRKLKGGYKEVCHYLSKLFADGAIDTAPMIGFLLFLSMFNNAATYAAPYFKIFFGGIIPKSPLVLCIVLAILAPLGFFRGPLNLVGCGVAVLAIVISSTAKFPIQLLYPLFAGITTIVMQHIDITQSWVAWGFGYTKVDTKDYMKMSLPTGWIVAAILCIVTYFMYGLA